MKKTLCMLLITTLIFSIALPGAYAAGIASNNISAVFSNNDPRYILNGEVNYHDTSDSGVTPIIYNQKMYVPLRSACLSLGASVEFDTQNSQAVVKYGSDTLILPLDKPYVILNGQAIDADPIIIRENRLMVPIRNFAQILGLNVNFKDGYVSVSNYDDPNILNDANTKLSNFKYYSDYDEIKAAVFKDSDRDKNSFNYKNSVPGMGTTEKSMAVADTASGGGGSSQSSSTNVQVQGVDESDVIKTDGQYIYYMTSNSVHIVKAADAQNMKQTGTIERENEKIYFRNMYIEGDRLVLCGYENIFMPLLKTADDTATVSSKSFIAPSKQYTSVYVYDISDKQNPKLIKSLDLEGNEVSTRKIGNLVYLITNKYVYGYANDNDNVFPTYRDSEKGQDVLTIEPNKIAVMPNPKNASYLNIAVIDIKDQRAANIQSIVSNGHTVYMNLNALYICSNSYDDSTTYTDITRFELNGHSAIPKSSARVEGSLLNQFSMDEYNGYFRIALSQWKDTTTTNSLYIFDVKDLKQTGSLKGIAPGESIYSVRFNNDTGYIVTFKQTDPLFKIDLSNPAQPKITGQIKVPGYSNYLHPVGDNLVLGIGRDVKDTYMRDDNGKEVTVGTIDDGLKLSLFDISKDTPVLLDSMKLSNSRNIYTEAQYDHKALIFDENKNIVGFSVYDYSESSSKGSQSYGIIISIKNNKLSIDAKLIPKNSGDYSYYGENRLCYIDDVIYYINSGVIYAYNYGNYNLLAKLSLIG